MKLAALSLLVLSVACGDNDALDASTDSDASASSDAAIGTDAAADAAIPDDAGMDASSERDAITIDSSQHDAGTDASMGEPDAGSEPVSLLVFSRTAGFRHRSIADGIAAFRDIAADREWMMEATEDPASISTEGLVGVDVVVFLNTSGNILNGTQQGAFEAWIMAGGGWVGVHAASDTEYDWPWYGRELLGGAWFERHPRTQGATLNVEDRSHPATAHLAAMWMRRDEWYDFRTNPRPEVDVLITIDESSYDGGGDGPDHPMTWTREVGLGRSFYTALGHTEESYDEPEFRTLLAEAVRWTAGG